MGLFWVKFVDNANYFGHGDLDMTESVRCAWGRSRRKDTVVFKDGAVASKELIKVAAFSLKFDIKEPFTSKGGIFVFFIIIEEAFVRGPDNFAACVWVGIFFTQVFNII